jgi:aspartate aminotransferase
MSPARLAERIRSLKPSATVEMTERVRAARAAGRRIIGLSSGDPNLPTDPRIVEAATRAMRDGRTHYAPPAGEPELREAIAQRETARAGVACDAGDVLVTPGGKFALLAALMATVEDSDEVIVPEPGWVSYAPCVRLCGGTPIALPSLDRLDPGAVERAVTPRTRAVIVNAPANPTGRILPAAELAALVALAERHDFWIVFDQVYCDLVHDTAFAWPRAVPGGQDRVLVVDSLSKSFGMTGWRLGYLALPPGLARAVVKLVQHSIYCVPPFLQDAAVCALSLADELVPRHRQLFRGRLERAAPRLDRVAGISCTLPDAGFYLFPRVAGDDVAIARRWLDELGIAAMPGSAFGAAGAGHLRLSLTCPDAELGEALEAIARAGI